MSASVADLLTHVIELRQHGRDAVACLMVKHRGSTPQSAGSMMIVDDAAEIRGTIGGGCVEAEVRRNALTMLHDNQSGVCQFTLNHDYGWDDGLICGGTVRIAIGRLPDSDTLASIVQALADRRRTCIDLIVADDEHGGRVRYTLDLPPSPRLYIAGAGHIGQVVARHGAALEFDVTVFDDRPDLLARVEGPHITTIGGPIAEALAAAPVDDNTYCIVVTRGHKNDEQALHAVITRGAGYVGMIGSRRKVKLIVDDLVERGVDRALFDDLHAPIGLDIGAVSVDEIAISIAAQLVEVRRTGQQTSPVSGPMPFDTHIACTTST